MAKRYRISWFRIFYLILLIAIIFGIFALKDYVKGVMYEYEDNVSENYVTNLIRNAKEGDKALGDYLEKEVFSSSYGDAESLREAFYEKAGKAELTIKQTADSYNTSTPVYYISADGKPFLVLEVKEGDSYNRLGILTLTEHEISYCLLRNENSPNEAIKTAEDGTLSYTVSMPEGFILTVDGVQADISDAEESRIDDFVYLEDYTDVPVLLKKTVKGLRFEPELKVYNNGGEEQEMTKMADGSFSVPVSFVSTEEAKALAESVADPINIATVWSKFMTNDVGGSYHGLNTVISECKLLKGSYFCDNAEKWAKSVDITFVSHHRITSWTNAAVTNHIKYSDQFFSVDVYLEKNMHLSTGADRTDVFNNRMFFVYISDENIAKPGWYMVDMMSLEAETES